MTSPYEGKQGRHPRSCECSKHSGMGTGVSPVAPTVDELTVSAPPGPPNVPVSDAPLAPPRPDESFVDPDAFAAKVAGIGKKEAELPKVKPIVISISVAPLIRGFNKMIPEDMRFSEEEIGSMDGLIQALGVVVEGRPGEPIKVPWWLGVIIVVLGLIIPRIPFIWEKVMVWRAKSRSKTKTKALDAANTVGGAPVAA